MKIFIFSDTHLGLKNNNQLWHDIQYRAHYDFILPEISKRIEADSIIIHSGDVFDNRSSIGLQVIATALDFYEKLEKLAPVYILAGNHDIYKKDSTEITSIDILKFYKNVHIIKDCTVIYDDILLMPWRKDIKEEKETLIEYSTKCRYAFMHGTFSNIKYNKYVEIKPEEGVNSVTGYDRIYSGHIHWQQVKNELTIIGSPYQMTRGDSDNKRGLWILDTETNEQEFIENTISPKYISIELKEIDKSLHDTVKGNFVDLYYDEDLLLSDSKNINKFIKELSESSLTLSLFPIDKTVNEISLTEEQISGTNDDKINHAVQQKFKDDEAKRDKAIKIIHDVIKEIS